MLLTLLTATFLPAQLPTIRAGQLGGGVRNVVISPEARLSRAKLVFKGETVNTLGGTRVRTWFQKNTDASFLGGNDLLSFVDGIATLGEKGSCYLSFATTPKTRYLVTFIGEFDCTEIGTMVGNSKGSSQGNATLTLEPGETSVMIPVKAVDSKMIASVFFPKKGDAKCRIQRVEVTEVK